MYVPDLQRYRYTDMYCAILVPIEQWMKYIGKG